MKTLRLTILIFILLFFVGCFVKNQIEDYNITKQLENKVLAETAYMVHEAKNPRNYDYTYDTTVIRKYGLLGPKEASFRLFIKDSEGILRLDYIYKIIDGKLTTFESWGEYVNEEGNRIK